MADDSKLKQRFPDISDKLAAPKKQSLFERQRAEAEAKRKREEAETAAVYNDFIRSFEDANDTLPTSRSRVAGRLGGGDDFPTRGGGGAGGRHFVPKGPRAASGPGSLGPLPPSLSRKRGPDGSYVHDRDRQPGRLGFDDTPSKPLSAATAFRNEEDEEEPSSVERAPPKPALHLSSLPIDTSQTFIKNLIPPNLKVDRIQPQNAPPSGPGSTERRSKAVIVTLSSDSPGTEIDTAVAQLQNKYVGRGYYLSISRHLSSAALGQLHSVSTKAPSLPFGAKPVLPSSGPLNRAPPPGFGRGNFAPPESFAAGRYGPSPDAQVTVLPPSDIKQLKLIHKTLEAVLEHGAEFEALLMSRAEVQREEKWAWIWDSRSPGGLWYRWRLWEILTRASRRRAQSSHVVAAPEKIFEGGPVWSGPNHDLPYEFTTSFEHLASDPEFDSEEEEMSDDEARTHRRRHLPNDGTAAAEDEKIYLNPLQKAKLTHLLARLPTTTAKLRKGDVARVTSFALSHASEGADEVVDMIVSNIERPFAWTSANPENKQEFSNEETDKKQEKDDPSSSKLIALYLVSDVLNAAAQSGVRHSYRYRTLFENALQSRKIFEKLGRLGKDLKWGRIRAERWDQSITTLLVLWEQWAAFNHDTSKNFKDVFSNPPLTEEEKREEAERLEREEKERREASKKNSKWKTVDPNEAATDAKVEGNAGSNEKPMDVRYGGQPMEGVEAAAAPPTVKNEAVTEQIGDDTPMKGVEEPAKEEQKKPEPPKAPDAARVKRARPTAADMFGSDSE